MIHYYIWKSSNPELQDVLRRVNEERSAAFYAGLKSFWNGAAAALSVVSRFVERAQRKARERGAIRELSALDERTLKDIGVPRGAIPGIARALFEGVVEPRPLAAARKLAVLAHRDATSPAPKAPIWLNGVIEGGRSGAVNPLPERQTKPAVEKAEVSCG